jgi:hypothetical protein
MAATRRSPALRLAAQAARDEEPERTATASERLSTALPGERTGVLGADRSTAQTSRLLRAPLPRADAEALTESPGKVRGVGEPEFERHLRDRA